MAWTDKIKKAIQDTVTLDVVTATGTIKLDAQQGAGGGAGEGDVLGFERIAIDVAGKIKQSDLDVVAFSHSQWDCDTFMFVKSNLSEPEQKLVEAHAATVDAAHANRREAVKMLKELVGLD